MTEAVCDSGPLTHLWQISLWPVFGVFDTIHLVSQVVQEVHQYVSLDQLGPQAGCAVHTHSVLQHELESCRVALPPDLLLQEADLATLALARRVAPDLVLTDDLVVRRAIETQGQTPMGSVGIW